LKLRRGDEFVVVGEFPSRLKKWSYSYLLDGPEYFGDLNHEACYLESFGKYQIRQREGVEP
jgi:hypothetical protein